MLEINYIILIFVGLFPTLIIICFLVYCLGVLPLACYRMFKNPRARKKRNSTLKTLIELLTRMKYNERIFKD